MSTIAIALEAFINLGERIINLEKTKREDKQQVFKEIIDPLFVQLQPVAENYLLIFRKAEQDIIKNPNTDLSKTQDEIQALRAKLQLARTTVQTMAVQIHKSYKDEPIQDFAKDIARFFDMSLDEDLGSLSFSLQLLRKIQDVRTKRTKKKELAEFILISLDVLERTWRSIGQSYARAKIYCLSAPHLINKSK